MGFDLAAGDFFFTGVSVTLIGYEVDCTVAVCSAIATQ